MDVDGMPKEDIVDYEPILSRTQGGVLTPATMKISSSIDCKDLLTNPDQRSHSDLSYLILGSQAEIGKWNIELYVIDLSPIIGVFLSWWWKFDTSDMWYFSICIFAMMASRGGKVKDISISTNGKLWLPSIKLDKHLYPFSLWDDKTNLVVDTNIEERRIRTNDGESFPILDTIIAILIAEADSRSFKIEFIEPIIKELETIDRILLEVKVMQIVEEREFSQHDQFLIMRVHAYLLFDQLVTKDVETWKAILHIETSQVHGVVMVPQCTWVLTISVSVDLVIFGCFVVTNIPKNYTGWRVGLIADYFIECWIIALLVQWESSDSIYSIFIVRVIYPRKRIAVKSGPNLSTMQMGHHRPISRINPPFQEGRRAHRHFSWIQESLGEVLLDHLMAVIRDQSIRIIGSIHAWVFYLFRNTVRI
jgi:hypothetical protein